MPSYPPQYQHGSAGQAGQGPPPPPPQYPYGFGGDAPPPKRRRTGLIIGIIAVGVVFLAAIGLAAYLLISGGDDDDEPYSGDETTSQEAPTSSPEPETTGPPPVQDAIGSCLPYEPTVDGYAFDLSTDCDSEDAFWTITAASDDTGGDVETDGRLSEPQTALEVCGDDYGTYEPGETWHDWFFTYDQATSTVEELYCVEAVGNPDPQGREPTTPDTGDCFDDSDQWWSVDCDSDLAAYEVVDTVTVDPPEQMDESDANEASQECSNGSFYWQLTDVEGRTATILCGEEA